MSDTFVNESILNDEVREHLKENRTDHMKYLPDMEVLESDVMDQVISMMQAYDYEKYTERMCAAPWIRKTGGRRNSRPCYPPPPCPSWREMAQKAREETRRHFGNSVYLFTPLYIANYCENYCIYCGFNCHNKIRRAQLNEEEIEKEMQAIAGTGCRRS